LPELAIMRATQILAATMTGLMLFGASLAQGQGKLQKLEDKLGAAPAANVAAPGSGYLGGEFDDPRAGQKGVLVNVVRPGGPAEAGGLKASDLITAIDGKPVTGLNDLDVVLDKAVVGQKLRMAVNRAGRTVDVVVTLGTRPAAPSPAELNPGEPPPLSPPGTAAPSAPRSPTLTDPSPALGSPAPASDRPGTGGAFSPRPALTPPTDSGTLPPPPPASPGGAFGSGIRAQPLDPGSRAATPEPSDAPAVVPAEPAPGPAASSPAPAAGGGPSLGITVDALTDEARTNYGLTVRRGALITHVRPGTPADRAGLPVGGVVVALDGRRIDSANDLVTAVSAAQPGQEIELSYYEGNRFGRKTIRLAPASAPAAPGSLPRASGGMSGERSMLGQVERRVDNFVRGGVSGPSTVYDPSAMAELQRQVGELTATVKSLEERLRALEGNRGIGAAAGATPAPAVTPGFGTAPITPATPGFIPGFPQPATNP